jgi:hypothetical protein
MGEGVRLARSMAIVAAMLSIVAGSSAASASGAGGPSSEPRFVPDAVAQFNALSRRPEALAFRRASSPEATLCKHYQGMARKDGPDGTPYVFLTKSGNVPDGVCFGDHEPGYLIVARMGSREKTGERLRSNLWPSGLLPASDLPDDVAVTAIPLNGEDGWPRYRHPGGMQIMGDVLAIGVENPAFISHSRATILFVDVSDPENPRPTSRFDPPDLDGSGNGEFGADPVGLTAIRGADGSCCRYLMIVAGGPGNAEVRFFRSLPDPGTTTTDLKSADLAWEEVGRYSEATIESCLGANWPTGGGPQHQMLNLVRQGDLDGPLFLVGGRNATNFIGAPFGDDFIDLYRVNLAGGIPGPCPLTHVRSKQMGPKGHGTYADVSNFATAAGVYVSPSGELIVYAGQHTSNGGGVFFGEYRHRDMVRPNSPTLHPTVVVDGPFAVDEGSSVQLTGQGQPAITKAWIQLFEEEGAEHRIDTFFDAEPWLPVDYADRNSDAFDQFDRFGIAAQFDWSEIFSSWRWFAPQGCTISANDYPIRSTEWPGPDTVLLRGTGNVEVETVLDDLPVYSPADTPWRVTPVPAGVTPKDGEFDDEVGGITFGHEGFDNTVIHDCDQYYDAPIGLGWDLDGDSSYEVAGASATFSAASLDGPTTATVGARAQHPTDPTPLGAGVRVPVPVQVRNVAPHVVSAALTDSVGNPVGSGGTPAIAGLPLTLDVDFTDPGQADTHTGSIAWGDGPVDTSFDAFSSATSGALGRLRDAHAFAAPGTYEIIATITDDDGGATQVTRQVEVLSLADAIEGVADRLTALIAQAANSRIASALLSARDQLIGNHAGSSSNGALDKLDANDLVSAITKLRAAISDLALAESRGAGDLSALKDLLGLVAEGIATAEYHAAEAAVAPPSPGEAGELARIRALIIQGHEQLSNGAYLSACDSFRQATQKARALST